MAVVGIYAIVMGVAMAAVWTHDIVSGEMIDLSRGRWRARDPQASTLMVPHWVAEYATAGLLVLSGIGLLIDLGWAVDTAFVALGALVYTSINSLGWALAVRTRSAYAIPMTVGALGGLIAIGTLLSIS